jgi:hypothetical protein
MIIDSLYKNDNGVNGVGTTITLNKSWKDYDILVYLTSLDSENPNSAKPNIKSRFILVSKIKEN